MAIKVEKSGARWFAWDEALTTGIAVGAGATEEEARADLVVASKFQQEGYREGPLTKQKAAASSTPVKKEPKYSN